MKCWKNKYGLLHGKNDWIVMQWLNLLSFEFDLTAPFKQNKSHSYTYILVEVVDCVEHFHQYAFVNLIFRMTKLAKWLRAIWNSYFQYALETGVFVEFIKLIINGEFNFDSTSQTDFQLDYIHKADSDSDSKVDFTRIKQLTTIYI